jgi:hypothetical protein
MTPEEKAVKLIEEFIPHIRVFNEKSGWENDLKSAKACTKILIDEILEAIKAFPYGLRCLEMQDYYEEVKEEIEKL